MVIRKMMPEDAAAVAELERRIFPDPWSERSIEEELRDRDIYKGYMVFERMGSADADNDSLLGADTRDAAVADDGRLPRADTRDTTVADDGRLIGADIQNLAGDGSGDLHEDDRSPVIPIGYLLASTVADEGEILRIGVLPAYRKRGIARKLMQKALSELDISVWFLEVRERNDAAIGLYRLAGFEQAGRRKGYYHDTREDAVIMRYDRLI